MWRYPMSHPSEVITLYARVDKCKTTSSNAPMGQTKRKDGVAVKVRCMMCHAERRIKAGEIEPGDHPMCDRCLIPMVPIEATSR
jgi:hypothetical protein